MKKKTNKEPIVRAATGASITISDKSSGVLLEISPEVTIIRDTRPGGMVRGNGEGMSIGKGTIRDTRK